MQATQFKQKKKRMYTVETTKIFDDWLRSLKDMRVKATIITRLERAENGNLGDHKTVGKGVSEMRIDIGKGYRLYYTIRGNTIIFMLTGGDKSTQQTDIKQAQSMKETL
ncbi:type II toxin-antitoxin system RelE/ParE family toxin [Kingella negevensis]|uniref:type II toxin-antitoxin system RelE/ParE family toxin n=2 Tax=Kingella negevensis TaxID=1522312 RepID=UPI00254B57E4|nr:type II toxin-antitoxin system RelE/ParE family toxin [Kingella negevensis]MDK4684801.1 type II toxin-antitoxin system RelE/ParE family toxin [Kingella negevensis]